MNGTQKRAGRARDVRSRPVIAELHALDELTVICRRAVDHECA